MIPEPSPAPLAPAPRAASLARIVVAQATFGFGWCLYLVQPKYLMEELHAGPHEVGSVGATSGVVGIVASVLLITVIDRVGGRRALFLAGSVMLALGSLAYLFVSRFGLAVYVLQATIGAAYVLSFNAAMALVTDVAPPERLGRAFGLQSAANLSMNAVSTTVAEAVAERWGWHAVFALAAVAGAASFAVGLGLPVVRREGTSGDAGDVPPYRALWPVFATSALVGAAFIAMFTFHQPFALSLGVRKVGSFFVGSTAAALLMRLGFGGIGDRFGRRRAVLASLVLYALVPLAMTGLVPGALWAYGVALGVAHGVMYPTLTAFATERAPRSTHGRIIAVYSGSFNAGTSAGSLAWGWVAAHRGYPPLFALASGALVVAVGVLGFGTVPKRPGADRPA